MLSILIVNYQNPALLRLSLKSLARVLPKTLEYEVVVVDVATSIETQNVVREEFRDLLNVVKLVPFKGNIGYTRGVNEGIRHSSGDVIFTMNADIIPQAGAIEAMHHFLLQHPEVGLVGPQLLNFDDSRQNSCFRFYTPLTVLYRRIERLPLAHKVIDPFLMRDVELKEPAAVDWLMGSALMARRETLDRVGFMDERFFLYFSEVDWARRFWENGYAVMYYPPAQMYHYHRRQSKGRFGIFDIVMQRESRWHLMDGIRYFLKHGFSTARPNYSHHGTA